MSEKTYDVVVIGGGPAGYTTALYTSRAGFDTLVLEKFSAGGQMTQTSQIDNYPGFDEGVDGFTLGFKMQAGAERFGTKTIRAEVLSVDMQDKIKLIETSEGTFKAKALVIASGAEHRHLGLKDEDKLIGKGVGYCAACDGIFYRGKTVIVVGGGNSAAADALLLSKLCTKVIVVHRRDTLRATKVYHEPLMKAENVEFMWDSTLEEFLYDEKIRGAIIKNVKDGSLSEVTCEGIFISIGRVPETELFKGKIDLDKTGYIIADESTKTNIDGVFAAGDVRTKPVRQIVTAVSDGATASHYVEEYIAKNF